MYISCKNRIKTHHLGIKDYFVLNEKAPIQKMYAETMQKQSCKA